jgi:hypothetical protein
VRWGERRRGGKRGKDSCVGVREDLKYNEDGDRLRRWEE